MAVYYTTAALLRTELGVTSQVLSDAAAEKIIEEAEDSVDSLLGGWVPHTTGRKVLEGDVDPWQWTKLRKATTIFAAKLYLKPDLLSGQQWKSVAGPDFSFSGPLSGRIPSRVTDLINDSGLRKMVGQAHTASQTRAVDREVDFWKEEL